MGEGFTQGNPVWSNHCERFQFATRATIRSAPIPNFRLKRVASSPTVIPCRAGMGYIPTKDLNFGSSSAPSTISPPIGLGRSRTTKGILFFGGRLHRERHRGNVGPGTAADLLEVVDQNVHVLQHLRRGAAVLGQIEREDSERLSSGIGLVYDLRTFRASPRMPCSGRQERDQLQILTPRNQVDV